MNCIKLIYTILLPNTIPITQKPILNYFIFYSLYYFPLLLLTSYQPHYHTLPPLHVHLYLTYFLIYCPIQFSHMYKYIATSLTCIPSHVTSLYYHNYYLDFIYFEKRIYYINCVIFLNNTYIHLKTITM